MILAPEDDPRLDSVTDKLSTLKKQIDHADWNGEPVTNAQRNEARRLTNLQRQGILWEPKF